MKALIFGAGGQLGTELQRTIPDGVTAKALSSSDCDITDSQAVHDAISRFSPDVILNAAAYTAVDQAESEEEAARAVNAAAVGSIADAARTSNSRLVHLSTDFVFDGSASKPIKPDAAVSPLGVYGRTKLEGEVAASGAGDGRYVIIRTSWVYSASGRNFVKTMLALMESRDSLGIVDDQVGAPTWAYGLAEVCWAFAIDRDVSGVFHWSDAGQLSWYEFAREIQAQGLAFGLLSKPIPLQPIPSSEYPTPARRPAYSVLDSSTTVRELGVEQQDWTQNLNKMMKELVA